MFIFKLLKNPVFNIQYSTSAPNFKMYSINGKLDVMRKMYEKRRALLPPPPP